MKNFTLRLVAALAVTFTLASPAFAQTALTTTTTTALIADTSGQFVSLTSATGVTAPGTGSTLVYLLIDKELLAVRAVNGLVATVLRGQNGTRATTHASGAAVTIAPPTAIVNYVPSGQCVRANLLFVPVVVGGVVAQSDNGSTFDCLGVTTAGQYVQTNANGVTVVGSTMASTAGVLGAFTGNLLTVSGTNAITGFTNPAGIASGFTVTIVPSGVFTWTAAGNIALAGTAVVNKALVFVWNAVTGKWIPNYIA